MIFGFCANSVQCIIATIDNFPYLQGSQIAYYHVTDVDIKHQELEYLPFLCWFLKPLFAQGDIMSILQLSVLCCK